MRTTMRRFVLALVLCSAVLPVAAPAQTVVHKAKKVKAKKVKAHKAPKVKKRAVHHNAA